MDIDEYKDRIEKMHTTTGVPTYWEQLQEMTSERDRWQYIAKMFYDNRFEQDREQLLFAIQAYEQQFDK